MRSKESRELHLGHVAGIQSGPNRSVSVLDHVTDGWLEKKQNNAGELNSFSQFLFYHFLGKARQKEP